jgi:hypothetical protein
MWRNENNGIGGENDASAEKRNGVSMAAKAIGSGGNNVALSAIISASKMKYHVASRRPQ